MPKLLLSEEQLEELDIPYCDRMSVRTEEEHRWYTEKSAVFSINGKHYRIAWNDPATELQEDMELWDDFPVEAVEVELREVTVKKWMPVKD